MGDGTGCDNMTAIIVRLDRFLTSMSTTSQPVKRPLPVESSADETPADSEGNDRSSSLDASFNGSNSLIYCRKRKSEKTTRR